MNFVRYGLLPIMVLLAVVMLVSSQITFSRDWKGGKRSAVPDMDCGQFTRLCKRFIHDLKQVMASDKFNKHREPRLEPEDVAVSYDDEK